MVICVFLAQLFDSEVVLSVHPALSIDGVMLILGSDVAGRHFWSDQTAGLVVVPVMLGDNSPDENE